MCVGPEFLAAAALTGAGKVVNDRQQSKNMKAKVNAKNASMQQEIARQNRFQEENSAAVNNTVNKIAPAAQEQSFGDLVAQREKAYADNTIQAPEYGNVADNSADVVKTDIAKRIGDAMAKGKAQAKALARMTGRGDMTQNTGLDIARTAGRIGVTNNIARGSLGVNAAEQAAAAANAGNKSSLFGDLLQAGGAAMNIYGAVNGPGSIFGAGRGTAAPMAGGVGPGYEWSNTGGLGIW